MGAVAGRFPERMPDQMSPKILTIGEAPSEHLNYYDPWDKLTQNTAGDFAFDIRDDFVHVFTSTWRTERYVIKWNQQGR